MYGKQNDLKHYEKVAKQIKKINPDIAVEVVSQELPIPEDQPDARAQNGLVIRAKPRLSDWEWRYGFWVNPDDECWVFRRGFGEGDRWEYSGGLQWINKGIFGEDLFDETGLHYRHFASVTALRFFRNGPLFMPGE